MTEMTPCRESVRIADELLAELHLFRNDMISLAIATGRKLVETFRQAPEVKRVLLDKGIEPAFLRRLEAIGEGRLLPQIGFGEPSAGRQELARCSMADQQTYLAQPFEVVVINGAAADTILVAVDALTRDQAKQIFDRGLIRSAGAQRAWLESQKAKTKLVAVECDYKIHGRYLVVRGVRFSKSALLAILSQMPD